MSYVRNWKHANEEEFVSALKTQVHKERSTQEILVSNILNLHRRVAMAVEIDDATEWIQLMLERETVAAIPE